MYFLFLTFLANILHMLYYFVLLCIMYIFYVYSLLIYWVGQLELLKRLHSEDTPQRIMITHTIDQFILDPV